MGKKERFGHIDRGKIEQARRELSQIPNDIDKAELTERFRRAYQRVLEEERSRIRASDIRSGCESLTTDTQGGRSADWFETTGKIFSVGHASRCVVAAVYHPDFGIGGSHKNTVTIRDSIDFAVRQASDPVFARMIEGMTNDEQVKQLIDKEGLVVTIHQTIKESYEQFKKLTNGHLPDELTMVIYGMNYLNPRETEYYSRLVGLMASKIPDLQIGKINKFDVKSRLGVSGELAWGGKKHLRFSSPTFM